MLTQSIIASLKPLNTYKELASLLGASSEFVRDRLSKHPERLLCHGKSHKVPYAIAVEFVNEVMSNPIRKRPNAKKPLAGTAAKPAA